MYSFLIGNTTNEYYSNPVNVGANEEIKELNASSEPSVIMGFTFNADNVTTEMVGVNDVWHEIMLQNGIDADKYFKIYCMLIEEIKEALPDTKIMILEPFVLRASATEERWDEFWAEMVIIAQKAREVAEKYDLLFIPLQGKFDEAAKLAPNEYWLFDGVHPMAAGYELIKRAWMEGFCKLVGGRKLSG